MNILDTLKKLNIVRAGSVSGTYKNAKDRPIALQDDMFLGKQEQNGQKPTSAQATNSTNPNNRPNKPKPSLLIASVIAALLFLFLELTTTIAWVLALIWVVWVLYIWLLHLGKVVVPSISLTLVFTVLCIFSFMLILVTQAPLEENSKQTASTTKKLTSEECKPYYDAYNGKVLKLSSDGLQGTVGIQIDATNGCKLTGYYNVLLAYGLPQNPYHRDIVPSYHYTVMLRSAEKTSRDKYDGHGELSPAYKNFTQLPDPFSDSIQRTELYTQGVQPIETRYFYWGYEINTEFSEARYQAILAESKLDIIDGTPFIEEEQDAGGIYSYGINNDRAAENGTIVKSYTLTIEE